MRKILDNIKILLADERGRALVKLSAYLLFMFFVILYARMLVRNSDNEQNLKTPYEKFISQIEYTADINYSGEEFSLIGGNITSFTYGEEQYIVVDSKLKKDEIEVDDFEIYFWEITPKFIGKVLENKEPEYTSNYKDGLVKKGYKISLYEFLKNMFEVDILQDYQETYDSEENLQENQMLDEFLRNRKLANKKRSNRTK